MELEWSWSGAVLYGTVPYSIFSGLVPATAARVWVTARGLGLGYLCGGVVVVVLPRVPSSGRSQHYPYPYRTVKPTERLHCHRD